MQDQESPSHKAVKRCKGGTKGKACCAGISKNVGIEVINIERSGTQARTCCYMQNRESESDKGFEMHF